MKTLSMNWKYSMFILGTFLIVSGMRGTSYAQAVNPIIAASTPHPLTDATLHGSVIILTLNGGTYVRFSRDIADALTVSGVPGVTIGQFNRFGQLGPTWFGVKRLSDTEITVELGFDGAIDTDATLTFTVGAGAITNYNGPALTTAIPVTVQAASEAPNGANNEAEVPVIPKQDPSEAREKDSKQDYIEGPWLWMIAKGSDIDTDYLAAESNGAITEDQVARNGVNEGDHLGKLQWTPGRIYPTTHCGFFLCASNNVNHVVNGTGLSTDRDLNHYSAYALINIISTRDRSNVQIGVGSDDSVKVWLNGMVVHRNRVGRRTTGIQDRFHVNLRAGNNLLFVKVSENFQNWGLFFKIYLNEADFITAIPKTGTQIPPSEVSTESTPVSNTTLSIFPSSVVSPAVGEQLEVRLNIADGKNVAGYQAIVQFDTTALRYVSSANGDYLPAGAFFVEPNVEGNLVKLNAASLAEESKGDGTLATLTFKVVTVKASTLTLSDVLLSNKAGESSIPQIENADITEPTRLRGDVNGDGIVNIQDLVLTASNLGETGTNAADMNGDKVINIQDLVLVAGALGNAAAAPSLHPDFLEMLTASDVRLWVSQTQQVHLTDATSLRGVFFLQQLFAVLIPKETTLLANYPNPFNPETWIPYQLAKDADVTLHIYAVNGTLVRTLALGHQAAGIYQNRSRAVYWDGRNAFGEPVASGLYFYTLTAGDFTATRKMLIRK